jgi:hypothetical protein
MAEKPTTEFGQRKRVAIQTAQPVKRSKHVALLLMGTFAIGSGAYALRELRTESAGNGVGITRQRRMPATWIFIQWRPRRVRRVVVAQQFLQ